MDIFRKEAIELLQMQSRVDLRACNGLDIPQALEVILVTQISSDLVNIYT